MWTNKVKEYIERPPNMKLPGDLITEWKRDFKRLKIRHRELTKNELDHWGCFKAVSSAMDSNPDKRKHGRCLLVEMNPKGKKTLVLIGKGIIFDSGGMQLKFRDQEDMKTDMTGIAYVKGWLEELHNFRTDWRIIGIMPMVVNGIGPDATLPGSVVHAFNKKTVEITNTDAEGRLVLADALSWAQKEYSPQLVIDVATLTGGAVYISGDKGGIVMGNNINESEFINFLMRGRTHAVWLPIWDEYKRLLKSNVADLKNLTDKSPAGTMMAGIFLSEFIDKKTPWIHLDIAGVAVDKDVKATGWGLESILHWIKNKIK